MMMDYLHHFPTITLIQYSFYDGQLIANTQNYITLVGKVWRNGCHKTLGYCMNEMGMLTLLVTV